jgi:hypothetical protein
MNYPFPGMDPYLEHPVLWPGLHHGLIHNLAVYLQPLLEPRYVATVEMRVYLDSSQRQVVPDLEVQRPSRRPGGGGGVAVAEPLTLTATPPKVVEVAELEIAEAYVAVRDLYSHQKLVTLLEVISPTNKRPGPGRDSYRTKQRETLHRDCHLVEIDLLRRGRPVVAMARWRVEEFRPFDYLVTVNRWPARKRFEVYDWRVRERLPVITVPLAEPDPDVLLDLQAVLEKTYWEGRYFRVVRYDEPCVPNLTPEDQSWATERWQAFQAARPDLFPPPSPPRATEATP